MSRPSPAPPPAAAPPVPARRTLPSLRNELLITFALLAAAAVVMAVAAAMLVFVDADSESGTHLTLLIALDACVLIAFGAYQIRRLVTQPLEAAIAATEAIAAGDLSRRVPAGATREFDALAGSVNRMTDHLLEAQAQHLRIEKLASVGRLAAGVAHEIGNPLGAINGYAHILRMRAGDAAEMLEPLDGLEREAIRIDRIVRSLLDYARPRRMTPTSIEVNDIVRSAVGLLHDQGILRRVDMRLALDADVPRLFGERHELEQVFVNLLLNAVDAMPQGAGIVAIRTRRVTAQALRDPMPRRVDDPASVALERAPAGRIAAWLDRTADAGEFIQVVVADSGSGVPPEDAERIFDPFFTTKEPGKGTGLGLAIVARIVDGLRGTVWVQPSREGGAAFVLLFASASPVVARSRTVA